MARRRKRRKWSLKMKIIVFIEGVILAVLLAGAGVIAATMNKIERIEVKKEVVDISITQEVEHKTGYLNVAVFGLDSRKGELGEGNLSDTIMIVSLNQATNEVKIVSVYRDTVLQLNGNSYNKANAAYSYYGPEGAIATLNKNLDLNIDKYVTVNFNAIADVVDAVGGIDMDLTYEEVVHMNNYCVETSKVTGKSYKKISPEKAGTYHLNGVQAVSYSRIRYTAGGDAQRTVRQRLVINKILEKVQNLDLKAVNEIVDNVFPQVATNFTLAEMISYAKDFKDYKLGESLGFPNSRASYRLKGMGAAEVANTLMSNVIEVHQFLFGDLEYEPSSTVKSIHNLLMQRIASGYYDMTEEEIKKAEKEQEAVTEKPATENTDNKENNTESPEDTESSENSGSSPEKEPPTKEPVPVVPEEVLPEEQ